MATMIYIRLSFILYILGFGILISTAIPSPPNNHPFIQRSHSSTSASSSSSFSSFTQPPSRTPSLTSSVYNSSSNLPTRFDNETFEEYWTRNSEAYYSILTSAHQLATDLLAYRSSLFEVLFTDVETFMDISPSDGNLMIAQWFQSTGFGNVNAIKDPRSGLLRMFRKRYADSLALMYLSQFNCKVDLNNTVSTIEKLLSTPHVSKTAQAIAGKLASKAVDIIGTFVILLAGSMKDGIRNAGFKQLSQEATEFFRPLFTSQPLKEADKILQLFNELHRKIALEREQWEKENPTTSKNDPFLDPEKWPFLSIPATLIDVLNDYASNIELCSIIAPFLHPYDRMLLNKEAHSHNNFGQTLVSDIEEVVMVSPSRQKMSHIITSAEEMVESRYDHFMQGYRYVLVKNKLLSPARNVDTSNKVLMEELGALARINMTIIAQQQKSINSLLETLPDDIRSLYGQNGTMPIEHLSLRCGTNSSIATYELFAEGLSNHLLEHVSNLFEQHIVISLPRTSLPSASQIIQDPSKLNLDFSISKTGFPALVESLKTFVYGKVPVQRSTWPSLPLLLPKNIRYFSSAIQVVESPFDIVEELENVEMVNMAPRTDIASLPRFPLPRIPDAEDEEKATAGVGVVVDTDGWLATTTNKKKPQRPQVKKRPSKNNGFFEKLSPKSDDLESETLTETETGNEEETSDEGVESDSTLPASTTKSITIPPKRTSFKPTKLAPLKPSKSKPILFNNVTEGVCEGIDESSATTRFGITGIKSVVLRKEDVSTLCTLYGKLVGTLKWKRFVQVMTSMGFGFQARGGSRTSFKDPLTHKSLYCDMPHPGNIINKSIMRAIAKVLEDNFQLSLDNIYLIKS